MAPESRFCASGTRLEVTAPMSVQRNVVSMLVAGAALAQALPVLAICREVTETDSSAPAIDPEQEVLFVQRSNWPVGSDCSQPPDADAGAEDAGTSDAGADAGAEGPDAGTPDAGPPPCATLYGDAITMVVQPRFYAGEGGSHFALLMVTPSAPVVELAASDIFDRLRAATAPIVTTKTVYIEDSRLGYQCDDPKSGGGGCNSSYSEQPPWQDPGEQTDARPPGDGSELQTVGPYDVATLAATNTEDLASWLDLNGFAYNTDDLQAVSPYLLLGWRVIAVRVHQDEAVDAGALQPLSFTYPGTEMRLPLGISRQPGGGQLVLSVYVAADGRYDVPEANVPYAKPSALGGGSFLTRNDLFADLSRGADRDPVATRVSGDPTFHQENIKTTEIRIPSSQCPSSRDDDPVCGCRTGGPRGTAETLGLLLMAGACVLLLRRRRR